MNWEVTNTLYFVELNPALKAIDQKLQEYKSKFKGATLAALQSDLTASKLQFMGMPTLINDFPVLQCQQHKADNELPALDWVRTATKTMTLRFLELP